MKYLIIALISLGIAVGLGQFIADDTGFVVIGYGDKVLRTSFVFFVVMLVIGLLALYIVWRLLYSIISVRTSWLRWSTEFRRKRNQRALSNGLIALAEGDYSRAEQLLSRGADDDSAPAVHYLGAAEAAQAQDAEERRDNYLSLAREAMPSAEAAIGIKRAQMQLSNQQLEQARATLDFLSDRHPENKQILALQHRAYKEIGDEAAVINLLPALRRHRVFGEEQLKRLEIEATLLALEEPCPNLETLHSLWNSLPKTARDNGACLAKFTRQLAWLGEHIEAEKMLRKALDKRWHPDLAQQYGDVRIDNADLQLERAGSWQQQHEDDPSLLLCLAKLSGRADKWDDARTYLQRLIEVAPSPMAYQLLAAVYEQANDTKAMQRCYREGLLLATGSVRGVPAVIPSDGVIVSS